MQKKLTRRAQLALIFANKLLWNFAETLSVIAPEQSVFSTQNHGGRWIGKSRI
jgi:hypothetical protein